MNESQSQCNSLSEAVIAAAMEVHTRLGPGLLEQAYEQALCHELTLRGLGFRRQAPLAVNYKGTRLDCAYRADLIVEETVLVELKSVRNVEPIHQAQLLTYLRLSHLWIGLLLNFNVRSLRDGIKRFVNGTIPDNRAGQAWASPSMPPRGTR